MRFNDKEQLRCTSCMETGIIIISKSRTFKHTKLLEHWPNVLGTLVIVALMILPPDLVSVMVALRMAMPNSMSLMFPMMLPRAFWGPPDKKKRYLKRLWVHSTAHIYYIYLQKCLTWAGLSVTPGQLRGVSWTRPTTVARRRTITETDTCPLSAPTGSRAFSPRLPWTPVTIHCNDIPPKQTISTHINTNNRHTAEHY